MVTHTKLAELLELSAAERLLLVEDLWDSIAATPESVPVSDAQRRELDARLAAHDRDPQVGRDWEAAGLMDGGAPKMKKGTTKYQPRDERKKRRRRR